MLKLPEGLRGTTVQCPVCGTMFQAPGEDVSLVTRAVPVPTPAEPERPLSRSPLAVLEDEEEAAYYRVRKKVEKAASWLRYTVLFDMLSSVSCCPCFFFITARRDVPEPEVFEVVVLLGLLVELMVLAVITIGSYYLIRRRLHGLVVTAAVLCFLLALKTLLFTAWPGLLLLFRALMQDFCLFLTTLAVVACTILATVSGIMGGTKTLLVLQDPEVRLSFLERR